MDNIKKVPYEGPISNLGVESKETSRLARYYISYNNQVFTKSLLPKVGLLINHKNAKISFHKCLLSSNSMTQLTLASQQILPIRSSGGSRIFRGGGNSQSRCKLFFGENCMKMKEIGPPRGKGAPWHPLGSRQCVVHNHSR